MFPSAHLYNLAAIAERASFMERSVAKLMSLLLLLRDLTFNSGCTLLNCKARSHHSALLCSSAEKHPARGIFAAPEGPRRRKGREDLSQGYAAIQAALRRRRHESDGPAMPEVQATSPSDPPLPPGSPEDEPSPGGDSHAAVQPRRAVQPSFTPQDSEEQEGGTQPSRPETGAQRAITFLLDSKEQDGSRQGPDHGTRRVIYLPDSEEQNGLSQQPEGGAQQLICLPDSEEQIEHSHQPEVVAQQPICLPDLKGQEGAGMPAGARPSTGPSREQMQQASAVGLPHAMEDAAADIDVNIHEDSRTQKEQTEEEFGASIAHLPPAKQRELRDLRIPWASDK